uniref:Tyrosine-protein kinase n=1 Tax=Trichuris muris TaxID=70415 RepID=A0A5S6QIC8_TRIMR
MKNEQDRESAKGQRGDSGSGREINREKYHKLTQGGAYKPGTKSRLDRIRFAMKDFMVHRRSKGSEKVGQISKVTSQPMTAERAMDSRLEKVGTGQKEEPMPLERYSYYHGCLSRMDAEEILSAMPVGHFLIRASKRTKESFAVVLSIHTSANVAHYQIPVDDSGKFYFNEFAFDTVHELLYFHWKQRVPISLLHDNEVFLVKAVDRPDWLFDDNEVILEPKPLGEGNFGAVYRGYVMLSGKKICLAVKTLQNPEDKHGREELLKEARVIRRLRHPNIVWCVGITVSSEATMVLLEFVTGGSLDKYLRKNMLSPGVKVKLLLAVANAVEYIHKNEVLHRDLAARNCLLVLVNDRPESVKLCDFGLSQEKVKEYQLAAVQQIPVRWSAPETLGDRMWTQKTDVWSYGVMIYEFFSNASLPYFEVEPFDGKILLHYLKEGNKLRPSKDMPPEVVKLMQSTFDLNPAMRPNMTQIIATLQNIMKKMSNNVVSSIAWSIHFALRQKMEGSSSDGGLGQPPGSMDNEGIASQDGDSQSGQEHNYARAFECNICLECAREPVLSECGHMFCWPCLYQWLEARPRNPICPVCKAAIGKDKITPVYGRGGCDSDPRQKGIPPRPQGRRTEPSRSGMPSFQVGGADGTGFQLTLGIGAFPFTLFTSTFNFGDQRNQNGNYQGGQVEDQQLVSRVFFWIAVLFLFWLIIA